MMRDDSVSRLYIILNNKKQKKDDISLESYTATKMCTENNEYQLLFQVGFVFPLIFVCSVSFSSQENEKKN